MKNRTALRSYFLSGSIPTEMNFHELINSGLNQEEDGIRRAVNGPLELEAQGAAGEILHLYGSFRDTAALWKIGHKPALAGAAGAAGLNIADAKASRLFIKADDGSVGIGTDAPAKTLDVVGSIGLRTAGAAWDHLFLHHDGATAFVTAGGAESGLALRVGSINSGSYDATGQNYKEVMRLLPNGNVGIGLSPTDTTLDLARGTGNNGTLTIRGTARNSHFNNSTNEDTYIRGGKATSNVYLNDNGGNVGIGTTAPTEKIEISGNVYVNGENTGFIIDSGGAKRVGLLKYAGREGGIWRTSNQDFEIGRVNVNALPGAPGSWTTDLYVGGTGNIGIGTSDPKYPLHVTKAGGDPLPSFRFYNYNGPGGLASGPTDVSIFATARVVGAEFNATSDYRLKSVVGRSDCAADLALLNQLRITDYTMRDRVQFGDQTFKKIIAQELEEVFPQAVSQSTGFLPDIYARASQVQRQGAALLLSLPAGLPAAATAGQRLKLIGPAGEVLATLAAAAAAGSQQLLVAGADRLADTPDEVFVFGLEHADVRTVDYDAVAMLNVSATQALTRQVAALHQQTATLTDQHLAQSTQADELRATLHLLQQQVAGLVSQPVGVAHPA